MGDPVKTIVILRLEVQSRRADQAFDAVDRELDEGTLQDAINASGTVKVLSATCGGSEMVRALVKELGT